LYTYNNDRIIKIDDRKNNASGYNENTKKSYMYDDNGNIVKDPSKSTNGSTEAVITYNYLNLPGYVDFGNKEIQFYYKDDGSLFKKEIRVNGKIDYARIYFDDLEFHLDYNGISNAYDDVQEGRVDLIKFSEGYLIPSAQCNNTANLSLSGNDHNTGMTYGAGQIGSVANLKTGHIDYKASDRITLSNGFTTDASSSFTANIQAVNCQEEINGNGSKFVPFYTIKNHLGNNIMEFTKNGSNEPSVAVEHKYFPFGLELTDPITPTGYEYLYNCKEKHDDFDLGYYNYRARFYDPAIGRFTGVDPLADQMPSWSPYSYTFNNPINLTDPTGMYPEPPAWLSKGIIWIRDKVDLKFSAKLTMGYQIGLKNNFMQFNAKHVAEIAEISLSSQNGSEFDYVGKDGEIEGMTGAGVGISLGLTGDDPVGIGLTYERQFTELTEDGTIADETFSNEVILPNGFEGSVNSDDKIGATLETELNLILIGIEISGGVEIDRKDE